MTTRKGGSVARARTVLILPDAHFPHHDRAAMACVLAAVDAVDPDEIVVLGDWLDAGGFSSHAPWSFDDGAHSYLEHEVAPVNAYLDQLQGRRNRLITYLEGNHEWRVERFFIRSGGAPARDLNRLASPERCLRHRVGATGVPGRPRVNFRWVPYVGAGGVHSHYKITPDLIAIHGWSYAADFNAVNEKSAPGVSIVCGHVHRHATRTSRCSITGAKRHYWSPGCLSQLTPLYMANNPHNWVHGFTVVYQSKRDPLDWTPQHVQITNGRAILPDGKAVSA